MGDVGSGERSCIVDAHWYGDCGGVSVVLSSSLTSGEDCLSGSVSSKFSCSRFSSCLPSPFRPVISDIVTLSPLTEVFLLDRSAGPCSNDIVVVLIEKYGDVSIVSCSFQKP